MVKMETEKELNKVKDLVLEILRTDERARNDDKWLILMVWQKCQQIKIYVPYDKIGELISPESIRRVRQKIQNEEKRYLPTKDSVIIRRRTREREIKKWSLNK